MDKKDVVYIHRASLIAQLVKTQPAVQQTLFNSWVGKICQRRDRIPTPVFLGFPCGSAGKESTCNARDLGSIPGLGRSPGEGKGYQLQYSGLKNSMDCIVHGGHKESDTTKWLSLSLYTYIPLYTWNGMELLSHKKKKEWKEWNSAICNQVDGPREYFV